MHAVNQKNITFLHLATKFYVFHKDFLKQTGTICCIIWNLVDNDPCKRSGKDVKKVVYTVLFQGENKCVAFRISLCWFITLKLIDVCGVNVTNCTKLHSKYASPCFLSQSCQSMLCNGKYAGD